MREEVLPWLIIGLRYKWKDFYTVCMKYLYQSVIFHFQLYPLASWLKEIDCKKGLIWLFCEVIRYSCMQFIVMPCYVK